MRNILKKEWKCIIIKIYRIFHFREKNNAFRDIHLKGEKQLKRWIREKKNQLVKAKNPNWEDWGEGLI